MTYSNFYSVRNLGRTNILCAVTKPNLLLHWSGKRKMLHMAMISEAYTASQKKLVYTRKSFDGPTRDVMDRPLTTAAEQMEEILHHGS